MPVRVVESAAPSQVSGQEATPGHALPPCTLLSMGRAFEGTQNVSNLHKDEAWRVNVRIQGCDLEHGYLCGTMEALNVPLADTPVVTFWEGEIVDAKNYTFYTGKWEATPEDDIRHWSQFPSFACLLSQVEADGGKSLDLSNYPYIFMSLHKLSLGTPLHSNHMGISVVCLGVWNDFRQEIFLNFFFLRVLFSWLSKASALCSQAARAFHSLDHNRGLKKSVITPGSHLGQEK